MGKNKKKEYVLDAVLDEETYMAYKSCLLYTSPSPRHPKTSRMPSSA